MYILIYMYTNVSYIHIYTVHDVQFVKGAVSMETLPEPISGFEVPEACFAGVFVSRGG